MIRTFSSCGRKNCRLTEEQKKALATVNALCGQVFLISDGKLTEAQKRPTPITGTCSTGGYWRNVPSTALPTPWTESGSISI